MEVNCPDKHGPMLETVKGEVKDFHFKSFQCLAKGCEKQAVLYVGGRMLMQEVKDFYGITNK